MASTITIAGGANITLSTAANAVTIRAAGGGAETQTAISGLANSETTYTSGSVTLSGLANVTIRSTTGQHFQFSVHAPQTAISGIQASDATYTSGTVIISGGNNITVSSGANQSINIHGPASHAQQTAISGLMNTETTYTSGTVELEGTNNITVFSTTGQRFRISGANTHAQQTGISAISNSNTTYTSGTVGLSELGAITIRSTTGNQFQFSVNSQTVQTQGGFASMGVSTGGNTAGDTGVNTGHRLVFVGTDNISLSQGTGASSTTISIRNMFSTATSVSSVSSANAVGANNSRFALEAHIHEGVRRIGISTQGNTSGSTGVMPGSNVVLVGGNNITLSGSTDAQSNNTITISAAAGGGGFVGGGISGGNTSGDTGSVTGRLIFAGTNNITLSGSTNAGSMTISISGEAGGGFSGGVSNLGNTAGSTGVTGTRNVFVGTNHVTLSQSTDANGATITVNAGPRLKSWQNQALASNNALFQTVNATAVPGTLHMFPLCVDGPFPGDITANTWNSLAVISGSTATMTQAASSSWSVGLYTLSGSTMSLLNSASTTWTQAAAAGNSNSMLGTRWLTIVSSQWSSQPVLYAGSDYYVGWIWRTSGVMNQTYAPVGQVIGWSNSTISGTFGANSASATSRGIRPGYGRWTATSAALPGSINITDLNKSQFVAQHQYLVAINNSYDNTW